MTQIFGDFREARNDQEYLIINFSPTSIPLQQRWRNNGLSANFLAGYVSTFFPASQSGAMARQVEIKHAVSYIANELLENAMKFNHQLSRYPISIGLHLQHNEIIFYVINSVDSATVPDFQALIEELLSEDPDELYICKLENKSEEEGDASGLGLLSMINDYEAKLAWKFEVIAQKPELMVVTTMVQLTI